MHIDYYRFICPYFQLHPYTSAIYTQEYSINMYIPYVFIQLYILWSKAVQKYILFYRFLHYQCASAWKVHYLLCGGHSVYGYKTYCKHIHVWCMSIAYTLWKDCSIIIVVKPHWKTTRKYRKSISSIIHPFAHSLLLLVAHKKISMIPYGMVLHILAFLYR